jgi:ankyrin repeat protein
LQYLSTKGIDLEAEDQQGRTPLYLAATWGHADCVKFLLTKSVWVDSYDSADCTALHKAARAGHVQVIKLLLGHGAKIEQVNNRALTPLGEAVASGRDDAAAVLLQAGADINTRPRGHTLLQLAAGMGSAQLVKLLVKAGCQVDEVAGPEGLTALHAAALSKDPAAAEALMQLGADASITSSSGQVAADLIDEDGSPATRQLLNLLQPAGSSGRSSSKAAAGSKGRTAAKKTAEAAATAAGDGDSQLPYAQRFASQPRQEQLRKVRQPFCLAPSSCCAPAAR